MVCDRSFELNLDCQASVVLTMLSNFFKPIILQRRFCAIAGVLGGLLLTQAVNYSQNLCPVAKGYRYDQGRD
jgi:hypothetical protein